MLCFLASVSASLPRPASTFLPAIGCELAMSFELILGGAIAVGLFLYLVLALLRPEKF
jgi:K+-transporting ATPase KdpF subunit